MALLSGILTAGTKAAGKASDLSTYANDAAVKQYADSESRELDRDKAVDTAEKSRKEFNVQSNNKARQIISSVSY